jgi:predicted MFS family arabinose efflux permease
LSLCAVVLLSGLCEPCRAAVRPRHPLQELREGAAFVFGHPLLAPVLVTKIVFGIAFFMLQAVYVPYAAHRLGLSASGIGATLAVYGVGMVVGALLASRMMLMLPFGVVIVIGPIAGLAAAALMLLTLWTPSVLLAALSFFLIGAGPVVWIISTTTLRQTVTPSHLLARVSAIDIAAYGARPVGAALGALVGGLYGEEACLVIAAIGFVVQAVVIFASPVLGLVRQPEMVS